MTKTVELEYLIIGGGPGGLQLAYYLQQAGASYLVLESGPSAGTFFGKFPRHRTLISINKPHVGGIVDEAALRYDWNSLLGDDTFGRLTTRTPEYFPPADELVAYLGDYAEHYRLCVRYNSTVRRITRDGDFAVTDQHGNQYVARQLVVATGFGRVHVPAIPGIDLTESYEDFVTDPSGFTDLRVLIIGKGNSAFETADSIGPFAATTHVASPHPVRFAWQSRYIGNLRAINNNFLDTYHLKSQNAVLDAELTSIQAIEGGFEVNFTYTHAKSEQIKVFYHRVVNCTGFRFDNSLFDADLQPALCHDGRFPDQTSSWESVNVPGLYFAGTLMHALDYRQTMSGFIHGFRYNVRFLAQLLLDDAVLPSPESVDGDPIALARLALDRINVSSAMFLQPAFIGDVLVGGTDGGVAHHRDVPVRYVHDHGNVVGRWCAITMEYGPEAEDPFNIARDPDPSWARYAPFLHPVLREYENGAEVQEVHVLEDLENHFTVGKHLPFIEQFFRQSRLASDPRLETQS